MVFMQMCQNYTLFDMTISCRSDTFRTEVGKFPYESYEYFSRNFPQLFMEVYRVIKEERRWIERPKLNKFFAALTERKVEIILSLLFFIS